MCWYTIITINRTATFSITLLILVLLQACNQNSAQTDLADSVASNEQIRQTDPMLKFSSESLDFGFVAAGDTAVMSVTLSHTGDSNASPITIQATSMDELDSKYYTNEFYGPATLYPGDSVNLILHFTPEAGETDRGDYPGTLFITHSGESTLSVLRLFGRSSVTKDSTSETLQTRAQPGISFSKSQVDGIGNIMPTSLQFGPDGRLYVADMLGAIKIYNVQRLDSNNYTVIAEETIDLIKNIPNHDDNGQLNPGVNNRLVTGILVTGTAANPVIYVASSDPRIGGGTQNTDTNLDTNSTMLSRLTFNGNWVKQDLVRGLPRSEENHHANGMILSEDGSKLLLAMGGNTNAGAVSSNFALLPEFALSAAILEIDLNVIGNTTYDLPTLDDQDRPGVNDSNDPFGGNQGKNQARLVVGGPVQIYAPGFRNAYDLVRTSSGKLYSIDNGPNSGWGAPPIGEGTNNCTNAKNEPGNTYPDSLHLITGRGYYAGHANPTRGNKGNTFNNNSPQSPVPSSNPVECDYRIPGTQSGALITFPMSTNGFTEYSASNFGGQMAGDLIATGWNNRIYRIQMNNDGTAVVKLHSLFSNFGKRPLDVIAQGDGDIYPGTIWVADFSDKVIFVFEPSDYEGSGGGDICYGTTPGSDDDNDGFTNGDEQANNTDPCSAADQPSDADGDFVSDLTDTDDDNDGIDDLVDPFALDPLNGAGTPIPFRYDWENSSQSPGGISNLGFTGLMNNGVDDYLELFDLNQMTVSGAAGVLTIDSVPGGDPINGNNSQQYAFQLGINVSPASPAFTAHTRVLAPFSGITPSKFQSIGFFIGKGDQDNYVKLVINTLGATGGLQLLKEHNGGNIFAQQQSASVFGADAIDLYLDVDPATLTVIGRYQITKNGQTGSVQKFPVPVSIPSDWLTGTTKLAVGIISTSFKASPFAGTWDLIEVTTMLNDGGVNLPPSVNAGVPCTVNAGSNSSFSCNLLGQVSDDGLPGGVLDVLWTTQSGPGVVTFSNAAALDSSAEFSLPGNYTLRLLADDGEYVIHDDVTVTVTSVIPTPDDRTVVYRINTGGPALTADGLDFISDVSLTGGFVNTGKIYTSSATIDTSAIPGHVPAALFQSERYDALSAPEMKYDLPVSPGDYEVRLFFAETWSGAFASGKRVFDVDVEGTTIADLDIYAEAGGLTALMKVVTVTSDSILNIGFIHKTQNPAIKGIEVIRLGVGVTENLAPNVFAGADQAVDIADTLILDGSVDDDGMPDGTLDIQWSKVSGPGIVSFASPDQSYTTASFSKSGQYFLQLMASDGDLSASEMISVFASDNTVEPDPISAIRINAGGPAVSAGGVNWLSDQTAKQYVNTGKKYTNAVSIDLSAVSTNVPEVIFQSERWDKSAAPEMTWTIPVTPGDYVVRLYFSEIYSGAQEVGKRVFSVNVEGTQINNIDVFAEVGANAAMMRSVVITSDSAINIDFAHIIENPSLKGIEILPAQQIME